MKTEGTKGLGKIFDSGCFRKGTSEYGDARRDPWSKKLGNDESKMINIHDAFQEI